MKLVHCPTSESSSPAFIQFQQRNPSNKKPNIGDIHLEKGLSPALARHYCHNLAETQARVVSTKYYRRKLVSRAVSMA